MNQKITPFLWYDNNAEEAVKLYTSIFKGSKVVSETRNDDGTLFIAEFELAGQTFMAMNGGPLFKFNESVSMSVDCKDQAEIDYFWDKLLADGGKASQCGWLKDKFGLSWQIVPSMMREHLSAGDAAASKRAMDAVMKMVKLDVKAIQDAYDGK